jgi:mannose/cellobiose epimerase-like protein (N-acyl-D-glucosamine 2-epimerase family)
VGAAVQATRPLGSDKPAEATQIRGDYRIAGRTLAELRDLYHRDLFEDFLPFMERYVIDVRHGGFLCNTDFTGKQADEHKSPLYEGRGIWVYSFLYSHFGKRDEYLDAALRSVSLLRKSQPMGDELWCTQLNRDGSAASAPGNTIPPDVAVAEGLAAYAQASREQEALDAAKRLLRKCVQYYDRADYNPNAGRTFLGAAAPAIPGARTMGTSMILLRCAAQLMEIDSDPQISSIANNCVEAVLKYHFNPAFRLNNEILNHDYTRPANEYAQLVYVGHSLEISWMLLSEAVRRHDQIEFNTCAERFRRHVEVAWDPVYGGVFHSLQNVDENRWALQKLLWPQTEVLVTALLILQRTGSEWSRELFSRMYPYVREKYPLQAHGSPLWMYAADRQATFESFSRLPKRVEHYHHPRHLMMNLLCLDEMIEHAPKA